MAPLRDGKLPGNKPRVLISAIRRRGIGSRADRAAQALAKHDLPAQVVQQDEDKRARSQQDGEPAVNAHGAAGANLTGYWSGSDRMANGGANPLRAHLSSMAVPPRGSRASTGRALWRLHLNGGVEKRTLGRAASFASGIVRVL
jgi:hypothetical protein